MLLQLYAENHKNSTRRFFQNLEKPHYGPILDPLLWKPNSSFLSKNPSPQLFRLDHILTSCKKIRKFLRVFPEKNWQINMGNRRAGKQTNVGRVFNKNFTSRVQLWVSEWWVLFLLWYLNSVPKTFEVVAKSSDNMTYH